MRVPTLMVLAACLLIGMAGAWLLVERGPGGQGAGGGAAIGSSKAAVGGPFTLTDGAGRRVSDSQFRGRYMLVYFGYTYCPDVCPAGLQVMSAALDKLGARADKIQPIFITIDPERDTPAQMGEYIKNFHPRLIGLTGSAEEIATVAKAYRVYAKKVVDAKSPGDYTVDHTSIIYLMDRQGEFIAHFTHASSVAQIVTRLETLP